ncbi:MAG TPA: UDP-N-acetylmuramate:L-alanyl-gamma-D-glutamyl-meso-diaminopimelate ligase [Burkholderiales bacterium]|nr:UDP-N-acetylmuramate:L-alanyl-gamma-D-glutamyl-meso-diaminopimelate ligase [Burkholderiales bacterium]
MHIHILGICGTFMGGIAQLARQKGYSVTGCDTNVYPPMSTQLQDIGIQIFEGYSPDQVQIHPDLFIIGNALSRGNPLVEIILDQNLPYTSGPQWLAEHILNDTYTLAVAGTHGKTTTASILSFLLEEAGLSPGFLIGGVPNNFEISARLGKSPFFVVEADEYDTAFFDKRSKFVHYRPRVAILNNLEYDHADIFANLAAIETQFHHFIRTIPASGLIIMNSTSTALDRVIEKGCWTPILRFNDEHGFHAKNNDVTGKFDLYLESEQIGMLDWELLGEHNCQNALAAIAAARYAGVPLKQAIISLKKFQGVKRRLEIRGIKREITVYDDFAHHPTAIATTLAGLRNKIGSARLLAVIEPRSNTMKLGVLKEALGPSLNKADIVFCHAPENLGWDVTSSLATLGSSARTYNNIDLIVSDIVKEAKPGDHILIMSNGSFGGIHEKILSALS